MTVIRPPTTSRRPRRKLIPSSTVLIGIGLAAVLVAFFLAIPVEAGLRLTEPHVELDVPSPASSEEKGECVETETETEESPDPSDPIHGRQAESSSAISCWGPANPSQRGSPSWSALRILSVAPNKAPPA